MAPSIQSYDFHTYYNPADEAEKKFTTEFREKVQKEFAKELEAGDLRIHKFWQERIGPHPIPMWELDTAGKHDPALFARVLGFYLLNHGNLSVLIHPRTGAGDLTDHTKYALWLGHKQRLITSFLKD
ncbi:CIC11C00000003658 [Sungouiella intermedia]|uniref:CIC11C00000003658 n=1 Tax=Sungouiella intermedia TaxID=45354 RepID=A0A1L0CVD3_9ASCO|nr:CIC11C00000003658 [[Candida] intermedia]SGZ49778.1 CIC11C00000004724 [[Candida] intermedia]